MSLRAPVATHGGLNREDAVAQLRALHAITRASAEASNDDDVLRHTASAAQRALQAASVSIKRFERELGVLRTLVNVGDLGPDERELPEDETYEINEYATLEFVQAGGRGVVTTLDDVDADPVEIALLRDLGKHSAVDVPIYLDGIVWGELYATRTADMLPFTDEDVEFAEAVAAQVAAGIAQGAHARRLEALARLDPLTGLGNRNAVEERLDVAIDAYLRRGRPVSVVVCDVNGLKPVNDELGHDAGDRLLSMIAELLSQAAALLPHALAARLGGDEFALVVEEASTDDLLPILRDVCRRARELPHGRGVSCGVASTTDPIGHVGTAGDLLRLADGAQYRAKRGRAAGPMVAGRPLPPDVAAALAGNVDIAPGGEDTPHRRSDAVSGVVDEVVARLDECQRATALDRLATVGAAVAAATDAGAWWVSVVPDGETSLRSLRYGSTRPSEQRGDRWKEYFELGAVIPLVDFPDTARVIQGGWSESSLDDPTSDPAEHELLRQGGYRSLVTAGGGRGAERWLLEVFGDGHGYPLAGLGPTLRALVAMALSDAR